MAPCSTNFSSIHHIRVSERENIKLRKPVVEKMRRDRINSCIEQLKIILEKEFHKQEPNSKLEKADILEMTVSFLRQLLLQGLSQSDPSQGYPYYLRDSVHTLTDGSNTKSPLTLSQGEHHQTQRRTISPDCSILRPTLKDNSNSRDPMWRPW